jgi:hypothetical protein
MEKFISKTLTTKGTNLQKLFSKLQSSFQDLDSNNLKKTLKEIEGEISKKELFDDKILEGGLCPHIYQYGEMMLKNFGKPWQNTELREFLIKNFALPKDVTGYFCKICGELIAYPDNDDLLRFMGGERVSNIQLDDPLQSMIWKETMYIVTTYIRFNTLVPIKPLVSSIANGLRSILGEQESLLYRGKTNTVDSIRDTLSLHVCIYIYAALCSLMMANPNKIIFGREKSENDSKYKDRKTSTDVGNKVSVMSDDALLAIKKDSPISTHMDKTDLSTHLIDGEKTHTTGIPKNAKLKSNENQLSKLGSGIKKYTSANYKPIIFNSGGIKSGYKYVHGGKSTTDIKLYERYLLTTAMRLILLTKDAIIKRLKNMNSDIIKQIFLKQAYVWARKHVKPIKVEHKHETSDSDILMTIRNDAFYNYVYYAKQLEKHSVSNGVATERNTTRHISNGVATERNTTHHIPNFADVADVLNISVEKIQEDISSVYEYVSVPKQWDFGDKLSDDYTYGSFMSMIEYIKDKIYTRDAMPQHIQVKEYLEKYSYLHDLQFKIHQREAKKCLRSIFAITMYNDILKYNNFKQENIDLAQFYCSNGERHKIGTFIYNKKLNITPLIKDNAIMKTIGSGYGKLNPRDDSMVEIKSPKSKRSKKTGKSESYVEYSTDDIIKILKSNDPNQLDEWNKLTLVNERCEKCKILIRTAKSTNDTALVDMFLKIDNIIAFYQYFETRCPKGDLHDIKDNICSKCSFDTNFKKSSNKEYYEKYLPLFKKIEKEKQYTQIKNLENIQEEFKKSVILQKEIAESNNEVKHTYSLQRLAEWSQISGVKYNLLLNLGLMEGQKFDEIEKGKINPSKGLTPESRLFKTQALKLKGYILQVLRGYNSILNHENQVDFDFEIKEMLDVQKKIDISKIKESMPDFKDDFLKQDNEYKHIDAYNYANFLLEYLSSIIVDISRKSTEKYKPLSTLLVNYFTKIVLFQEKMTSKAQSLFAKALADITSVESDSEDEQDVSGDAYEGRVSDKSEGEFEEEVSEIYENVIDDEAYDVEDVNTVFENE